MSSMKLILSMASIVSLISCAFALPPITPSTQTVSNQSSFRGTSTAGFVFRNDTTTQSLPRRMITLIPTALPAFDVWSKEAMQIDATYFDKIVAVLKETPYDGPSKAIALAYDAAGANPSAESKFYTGEFAKYFTMEFPALAKTLADKRDGDKVLWFMGKAGSPKIRELFEYVIRTDYLRAVSVTESSSDFSLSLASTSKPKPVPSITER